MFSNLPHAHITNTAIAPDDVHSIDRLDSHAVVLRALKVGAFPSVAHGDSLPAEAFRHRCRQPPRRFFHLPLSLGFFFVGYSAAIAALWQEIA